jgi:glycosyltransferase involved in cell wall biosynthesis
MPKVALVIDALPAMGGAEKVLMAAMELFPQAPIYTLVYNRPAFAGTPIAHRQVITSSLERLPLAHTQYRKLLPLMPHMIGSFNLQRYDKVISFSYAVAHGVHTQPGQIHLSYTYTPMRYAWRGFSLNGEQHPGDKILAFLFQSFRRWDSAAVSGVDRFAAVSQWIAHLVKRVYLREAEVIYPPVEVERFSPQAERGDYYVTVARLVAHKRIDLVVEAFNRLKLPLLVAGEGPERSQLERQAQPNIRFLGFQSDQEVAALLNRARGYICAGEEDFGIAMVEAQAAGCPVVAYRKGGGLETVVEGQTGLFFDEPTSEHLCDAVLRCEKQIARFKALHIAAGAQRFNKERFLQEFASFTETIPPIYPQFPLPVSDSFIIASADRRARPSILGKEIS